MSRQVIRAAASLCLLGITVPPVHAQAELREHDPTIVVTGQPSMSKDQALEVVQRATRSVDGQLARFDDPVCPRVTGFDTPYERIVADRIKKVAEAVGARAGEEGCAANLQVVVVDDGREFVELLSRQHPEAFAGVSKRELKRLASEEGAARAWSVTVLTNSAGRGGSNSPPNAGGGAVNSGYGGSSVSFGGQTRVMRVYDASNINPSVQQAVAASWVVIETGATFGKSLTQIADYAAMRGLAMVRPGELAESADTILALFEPEADGAAPALTDFDRAYLKGLYSVQGRRWARQQVRQLADVIAREAERAAP